MAFKDKAQASKYVYQFTKEAYDRISLTVPKGDKERIKARAESQGESINSYINKLIELDMKKL